MFTSVDPQSGESSMTATAATMNLLAYVAGAAAGTSAAQCAEQLSHERSLRFIRIDGQIEGTQLSGDHAEPEILHNLPTVVWWGGAQPPSPRVLNQLDRNLAGIVLDSSRYDLRDSMQQLREALPHTSIQDLAWMRGENWRLALARIFDHPAALKHLQSVRVIGISGGSAAEAQYFGGWIASRLGWSHSDALRFRTQEGRLIRFFHHTNDESTRIEEIRLASSLANFRLVLDEKATLLTSFCQLDGTPVLCRHVPFGSTDEMQLMQRAFLARGTDELFEAALRSLRAA